MRTSGHKVLITGGNKGIGFALAQRFAAAGNRIIITGRDERAAAAVLAHYPDWQFIVCDLANAPARSAFLTAVIAKHPDLSVLINNAGVQHYGVLGVDVNAQDSRQEVEVNVQALVELTIGLLPILQRQPEAGIVLVSSGLAIAPKADAPVYCATKAFVRSFAKGLRYQLATSNVAVFDLAPPLVETEMTGGRGTGKISATALAEEFWRNWQRNKWYSPIGKVKLLGLLFRLAPSLAERVIRNS